MSDQDVPDAAPFVASSEHDVDPVTRADSEADRDGRYVRGRDGWLFLDHDSNAVIEQHSGKRLLSPEQLDKWERSLAARVSRLKGTEGVYLHLVPPNGHAVNEEFLPDAVPRNCPRPITQLLEYLARPVPPLKERVRATVARQRPRRVDPSVVVYPLSTIRAARADGWPYSKTETHWTRWGAWAAYLQLAEILAHRCDLRVLGAGDIAVREAQLVGDLGFKLRPPQESPTTLVEVRDPRQEVVSDNRIRNNGRLVDVRCPAAPPTRALVVGDSFSYQLLPFLSESFGQLRFAHSSALHGDLLEEFAPDVALTVLNERFIVRPPNDDRHPFVQLVNKKVERGMVMKRKKAARYGHAKHGGWPESSVDVGNAEPPPVARDR